jgi:hypothetical protein
MGRPSLAMRTEPGTPGYQRNIVPFDNHRRRLHVKHSSASETYPRGVVVRLPLLGTNAQTATSESDGDRLTPIDYIVALLLCLSTLTGPALVWTLLSF